MIHAVRHLIRTSLLSILFLTAALTTLVNVISNGAPPTDDSISALAGALAPVSKTSSSTNEPPAAARIALFDPERRPETVAGSIDDLRNLAAPAPEAVNVAIAGVLLSGQTRKAMLGVPGGPMTWSGIGAEIGGWRVSSIDAEGAVLEHDGHTLALKIADRLKNRARTGEAPAASSPTDATSNPEGPAAPDALVAPDPVEPSQR